MEDDCGLEKQAGGEILGQDPALAEVVGRLVGAYVPDDAPAERRRSRLAYEVFWGTGAAADVLLWTVTEFQSRLHVVASLAATVLGEGRVLDAA